MLRAIYPKSVNTIRMMVINSHGCDPKIMQTHMRIGSSTTGFTDNGLRRHLRDGGFRNGRTA